jgi:hypothetical protein
MHRAPAWKICKPVEKDEEVFSRKAEMMEERISNIKEGKDKDHILMRDIDVVRSYKLNKDYKKGVFKYKKPL